LGVLREKTLAALSKGMKQRVCLARAIIHDPAVLLLDEPAAGLDPRARIELRDMVRKLAEQGKTLLISSHILSELAEMCNGMIIMEQGRLLSQGTVEAIATGARPSVPEREVFVAALGEEAPLRALLESMPVVRSFEKRAVGWNVVLQGGESEAADVLKRLIEGGIRVTDFHLRKSTLEDVFMNVTKGGLN